MPSSQLKILHLEDSKNDAELVSRCLKNAKINCEIKVVDSKIDFQNSLKYFNPDIIISDHSLPQFDSTEALRIAQVRKNDIPFILVTGTVSEEFAVSCIKNGADDYLLKTNLTRLSSAIAHALKRREAEKNLVNSEKKFREMFENNPMPMWVLDLSSFMFLNVNEAALRHYGYTKEEFMSMTAIDIRPEDEKDNFLNFTSSNAVPHTAGVWKHSKKDGTTIHVEISVSQIIFDNKPARLVLANDVTEKIKAEEKLVRSENEIRNFAKHLNHVLEEERSRLAREIHDELGQQLAGIKIGLSSLKKVNQENVPFDEKVNGMMLDVDHTIQSLRKIATELRPGILDTLGLIPSIQWLAREFEKKTGMKCTLDVNVTDSRFEKNISTCFFRICQEALTNISKHAGASEVVICAEQNNKELMLKISDNGKGITSEKLENPFSMGLLGMRERANIIGADLNISSNKGVGTTVRLQAAVD